MKGHWRWASCHDLASMPRCTRSVGVMIGSRTRLGALAGVLVVLVSCTRSGTTRTAAASRTGITVAAFAFPESEILAELYAQSLEAGGVTVNRVVELASREIVEPAL